MTGATYLDRRSQLETYFDRTAADAWAKLTSDEPVSKIRATVRAGRDAMRSLVLDWLPQDLSGARLLDAGCGPGQFAFEAAARGADVVAVDLSPTLLGLARDRLDRGALKGSIEFHSGDMLDDAFGTFDYVTALDSLIHYKAADIGTALRSLSNRTRQSVIFTFAPRTPALTLMHTVGAVFPKSNRAPSIEPVSDTRLRKEIIRSGIDREFSVEKTERVKSGFYISQAMEIGRRDR